MNIKYKVDYDAEIGTFWLEVEKHDGYNWQWWMNFPESDEEMTFASEQELIIAWEKWLYWSENVGWDADWSIGIDELWKRDHID